MLAFFLSSVLHLDLTIRLAEHHWQVGTSGENIRFRLVVVAESPTLPGLIFFLVQAESIVNAADEVGLFGGSRGATPQAIGFIRSRCREENQRARGQEVTGSGPLSTHRLQPGARDCRCRRCQGTFLGDETSRRTRHLS